MGCIQGQEIVIYKYNDNVYCCGIERLWDRFSKSSIVRTYGVSDYIDVTEDDLYIWDSDNRFVKVFTLIKNPDMGNWYRITFSNGRTLTATENHPLYLENRGRTFVSDLKIGDTIETEFSLHAFNDSQTNSNIELNSNIAYILGLIITDGCYDKCLSITLDINSELDIALKTKSIIENEFGYECKIKEHHRGKKGDYLELYVKCSSELSKNLKDIFGGKQKKFRSIPSIIFNAKRKHKLSFIAGMMDGDGYIDKKNHAALGSTNKELALQQAALIQTLDLPAKVYLNHYSKKHPEKIRYSVYFAMNNDIAKYMACKKKTVLQWNSKYKTKILIPEVIEVVSIEKLGFINEDSFDVETESDRFSASFLKSGNCRTRVLTNVNGPDQCASRGNFSFTTINLPKLALEAKGDKTKFFELFDKYIELSKEYLLFRLSIIEKKHLYNFPFLMEQGIWLDSEKYKSTDTIKELLKHASYSIGFCGLAECLVVLTGKHHGESEEAQKLGLEIISHLRDKCDKYTEEYHMNWTCFASPAESVAGKMQKSNRKQYGIIKGVTDKDYMTNSFHVKVDYNITAMDKIKIEAPYHKLCNAGAISYIEMNGDPTKNIPAFVSVVRAMHDSDMGYFSINHQVDHDPVCGYTGIIKNECPHCHRKENGIYEETIPEL